MRQLIAIVLLSVAIITGGCFSIGGSKHFESENPTLGRQLQDLKIAHDKGAITQNEYQQAKTKLMNGAQ